MIQLGKKKENKKTTSFILQNGVPRDTVLILNKIKWTSEQTKDLKECGQNR